MIILLCSIEQKTQKNLAQLRKILSKKAKLSKKTVILRIHLLRFEAGFILQQYIIKQYKCDIF